MKDRIIYILKRIIHLEELSDLDFELDNKFGIDYEDTIPEYIQEPESNNFEPEGTPIEIDRLISFLQDLKKKGSNFVSMEVHCDHHGYAFAGLEIRLADKEQIQKHLNLRKNQESKEERIKELQAEIDRIKNS